MDALVRPVLANICSSRLRFAFGLPLLVLELTDVGDLRAGRTDISLEISGTQNSTDFVLERLLGCVGKGVWPLSDLSDLRILLSLAQTCLEPP